jgi:phosphoribosylformylglycinamidine (FGAM) synthase-like enzyme
LDLDLCKVPGKELIRSDFVLFSESNSRFLIEIGEENKLDFENLMKGKSCSLIGKVINEASLRIHGLNGKIVIDASLDDLRNSWKKGLSTEAEKK